MNSSKPDDLGPAMTIRLKGNLIVTAPALLFFNDQLRVLDLIESIYLNAPVPVPDAEWREMIGNLFQQSQDRKARHPAADWLDEAERRLLHQQDLSDRFGEAS